MKVFNTDRGEIAAGKEVAWKAGATRTKLVLINKTSFTLAADGVIDKPVKFGWLEKGNTALLFVNEGKPSQPCGVFFRSGSGRYLTRIGAKPFGERLPLYRAASEATCDFGYLAICPIGCVVLEDSYKSRRGLRGGWRFTENGWEDISPTEAELLYAAARGDKIEEV